MEDKAREKEDFFLKKNYYSLFKSLSHEKKGLLIEAIFRYECNRDIADFSLFPDIAPLYEFIINKKYF